MPFVPFKKRKMAVAIAQGDLARMKELLDLGLSVNSRDSSGWLLIDHAIRTGNHFSTALLIERGALLYEAEGYQRDSVLHQAAQRGSVEIFCQILEKKPEFMSLRNARGDTPLHRAAMYGRIDIVEELLRRGADMSCRNFNGTTPYQLAQSGNHYDLVMFFREHERKMKLEEAQAKPPGAAALPLPPPLLSAPLWIRMSGERIARVNEERALGYRITEIFNFKARECTALFCNMDTKVESAVIRNFSELENLDAVREAAEELNRRGVRVSFSGIEKARVHVPPPKGGPDA